MKKIIALLLFSAVLLPGFSASDAATSATTVLSGGGSVSGNYDITKTDSGTDEDWSSSLNAFLSLIHTREGEKGGLSLSTSANYSYELKDSDDSFSDWVLNFTGWRDLSQRLHFNISDSLIRTNDLWAEKLSSTATGIPDTPPVTPPEENGDGPTDTTAETDAPTLSYKIGQEKFWTNNFSASLAYQYAQRGSVTAGYGNTILRYIDEPVSDDYERDRGWVSLSYGFGPRWSASLSYSYTDAQFDISDDFTSHSAGAGLSYYHSVRDSFSANVNYSEKNYDNVDPGIPGNPNNNYTAGASLGWTHNFSTTQTLSMSAGPSYYHEDVGEDTTSANFNVNYSSAFENGSWFVGASGGFEDTSFDGVQTDKGISEYQSIFTGVGWQVAKDVNASLGASVRNDSFLENPLTADETTYNAYGNISYRFWRWFYVSGRYFYTYANSDNDFEDSQEHRFFITLGASRELYRWIH